MISRTPSVTLSRSAPCSANFASITDVLFGRRLEVNGAQRCERLFQSLEGRFGPGFVILVAGLVDLGREASHGLDAAAHLRKVGRRQRARLLGQGLHRIRDAVGGFTEVADFAGADQALEGLKVTV